MKSMAIFLSLNFLLSSLISAGIIDLFLGGLSSEYLFGLSALSCLVGAGSTLAVYVLMWLESVAVSVRKRRGIKS
jgi:hypothetical protein